MDRQELRKRAHDLDVTVWVGKGGVESVLEELRGQLDDRDLVKVKVLRAARAGREIDEIAEDLADRTGAELIETRGNTVVLH